MKKLIPALLLLVFTLASCCKPEPTPQPKPIPDPLPENSLVAEFKASLATFPAEGGKGVVEGLLKEVSPEGKVIKETPLAKSDFTLTLKEGDATQIQINDEKKEFTISEGVEEAVFTIVAQVKEKSSLFQEIVLKRTKGDIPNPNAKLPLEYVAEFNVGKTAGTFANSHQNDAAGYFSYDEVANVCPEGYHTPTRQEAAIIMPLFGPQFEIYLFFDTESSSNDVEEAIKVGNKQATYLCDYKSTKGSLISYALRFKKAPSEKETGYPAATDNKLQCAYRYEVVGQHKEGAKDSHLKITARLVGEDFAGTIEDIAKEDFWNKNSANDVTRILPSSVYYHPQSKKDVYGAGAFLWTATPYENREGFVWTIAYIPKMAYISYNSNLFKFGIRPVKDEN